MSIQSGSRQLLIHGMLLVLAGLVFGFVVPATPHPRLALGAHIQFITNGMLFIILATVLLTLPHKVGVRSIGIMVASAWLTWGMAMSEAANAWWGTKGMLPIAAAQAGVSGGSAWQEQVVALTHLAAGAGLIIAWTLLVIGFLRGGARVGTTESAPRM
jgi:hydroxylaminobenzene mutase